MDSTIKESKCTQKPVVQVKAPDVSKCKQKGDGDIKIGSKNNDEGDQGPITGKSRIMLCETVDLLLRETVQECFNDDDTYTSISIPNKLHEVLTKVKDSMKTLNLKRYKVVTFAQIVELNGQGIETKSKSISNHDTDFMCFFAYTSATLSCLVQVCGLYNW